MAQVLKEEVRNRILESAEKVFYKKDYRGAKLTEIAKEANIPVALIYTYFKNKEVLFDAVVSSVYINFESAFNEEESLEKGSASERFDEVGENYIHELLKERKKLIILMDKSSGTKHTEAKQKLISQMQIHIEVSLKRQSKQEYDPMLAHILASNFTEGLLEIARHYQSEKWAKDMLKLIARCMVRRSFFTKCCPNSSSGAGAAAAICSAIPEAKALKSSVLATKSVSQATSTSAPALPSA